ncbi:hypothetical protein BACSTE_00903 [Bacteroides stercoris ATCC 43183]|uniref:Uncharacterized protein n=1 Tax=Bacteroides stercoris ATCC 43183 TaxID=449673 RepID=B0NNA1_BACSE|nr:hypothetical protein BACSTE_00903 [Bacteroides stercoris ATCC 43183]
MQIYHQSFFIRDTKIQHPKGEVKQSEKRYEPFLKKVHIPLFYFRLPFQAD